jgi:thymidylate synthase ThyX
MIYAAIIADSLSLAGHRLTTMEIQFHRYVLSEFNTHRRFSRNSASSRAIPVAKQLKRIWENCAIPIAWTTEQPGMQGGPPLTGLDAQFAEREWLAARDDAIRHAQNLMEMGVHKSVTNRLLEPFMWHKVIVTSTEWRNFFDQRVSPLAQPEIHAVADCMERALRASTPRKFDPWHVPYVSSDDLAWARDHLRLQGLVTQEGVEIPGFWSLITRISAARCARVSYLTQDGVRDPSKDLELYDRLVSAEPPHWSPLEHVATSVQPLYWPPGNFDGWCQLRHIVSGEAPEIYQSAL